MTDLIEKMRRLGSDGSTGYGMPIASEAADYITHLGVELSQRAEDIHELQRELAEYKVLYDHASSAASCCEEALAASQAREEPTDDSVLKAALAEERERCAKVCKELRNTNYSAETDEWVNGTVDCAEAIRALEDK